MRKISDLFIHCSDTPGGMDIGAKEIRDWHTWPHFSHKRNQILYKGAWYNTDADLPVEVQGRRGNGWYDIGYHEVIRLDGTLEMGRPLGRPGAHVGGHNAHSIGICLIGGREGINTFSDKQFETLLDRVRTHKKQSPKMRIRGHRDVNPQKYCPSFDVKQWAKKVSL